VGLSINADKTDLILFTKRYKVPYASKKMLSSTWGLSPTLMHWIFISVVRPTLLYGALVWWHGTKKTTYTKLMVRTQRQALVCITGCLISYPATAAFSRQKSLP